ncbi:MAG: hypothetical protein ACLP1Q_19580 [Solirubrobacteraceae bacterium]
MGVAILVIVVLAWPMLFTTSALGGDWIHHLWYVWRESLAIRADHVPSMFLNTYYSVFYPQYAFYGGTIYAIAGTLAVALGDSPLRAYILTYMLGFGAAYGGWFWTARVLGLGRWLAHVPALLFVTSACYLTLVYGQGDWPEFIALSMLPLIVAAGLTVLRADRLRVLPAVALAASTLVFFGSHILTVLWASTLLGLTCAVVIICVPDVRRQIRRRGVIRIAVVVIPALLVNGWFLLPMAVYASHTRIGSQYGVAYEHLRATMHLVSFRHLFTLSRGTTVRQLADYALPLPTLTIVWVLASITIVLWNVRRGTWVRLLVIFAAITAGIVVVMTHAGLVLALPKPYTLLQFTYRLEGYILMGVVAAVLAILVLVRSGSSRLRLWSWTIVPVVIVSVIGAAQQVDAYPRTLVNRGVALTYRAEVYAQIFDDYAYVPLPFVSEAQLPKLHIAPQEIHGDHVSLTVHVRPGQLVATNIGGGPNLVHISGASVVGADERSQLVVAIGTAASAGSVDPRTPVSTERISIGLAQGAPVVLGRLLTLMGAVILASGLVVLLARGYRERAGRRSEPGVTPE